MKKIILLIIALLLSLLILAGCSMQQEQDESYKIVTSFYPMYTIAKTIADGVEGVTVENMASKNAGCLHDYTLTTADLKKIENADVFVLNGLGIENFTDKILETYSDMEIIEASENIENLIVDEHEENAHIWLSIDRYIEQLENVKQGLVKYDKEHSKSYIKNADAYKAKLENLQSKLEEKTKTVKKCLSFSESLAYLEESMNLNMEIIETDHEQNGLSAESLAEAIEYVKENNIKNILIDKQTADNNAQTVANETGAKIYILDSVLSGEDKAETYIRIMEENLKIVESME